MSVNLDYGVKDIKTLEGIEAIRLRPGIKSNCRCPLTRSDDIQQSDFVPELVRNGKLIFINFYDIIER